MSINPVPFDAFDAAVFRRVLGHYPSGVAAITSVDEHGAPVGLTVSSFTSVSLDPPLVAFFPAKTSSTWPVIRDHGSFCVNVLSSDHEDVCRQLATRGPNKFDSVDWTSNDHGLPEIAGAVATISCDIDTIHDAGDHFIVVGLVSGMGLQSERQPLLYFQGGYGRFASRSITALTETDIVEHIKVVEKLRPALTTSAEALGTEVLVTGIVHGEVVILATSGHPDLSRLPTRVGSRIPFVPPVGSAVAAFSGTEAWLARAPKHLSHDDDVLSYLESIKERGWAATLATPANEEFEKSLIFSSSSPASGDLIPAQIVNALGMDRLLRTFDPSAEYPVRSITVPVRRGVDTLQLALTAFGLTGVRHGSEIARIAGVLQEVAQTAP